MLKAELTTAVEFRTIERFPGYRFGSDGSVWSVWRKAGGNNTPGRSVIGTEWRRLKPAKTPGARPFVTLKGSDGRLHGTLQVSRLVLEAFVGPCPEGMEACHDPDPSWANNAITNLRWDTRANNALDKWKHGTMAHGESHPMTSLTVKNVQEVRSLRASGVSLAKIAARFNVSKSTIHRIVTGKTWARVK